MNHSDLIRSGKLYSLALFLKKGPTSMSLIAVLITLIVVGVLLWLVNTYIPMDLKIKKILNAVVVIVVIVWLLNVFGVFGFLPNFQIGNVHLR